MKIIQLIPTLAYGDAIGNDTIVLKKVIKSLGYKTEIYADSMTPSIGEGVARSIKRLPKLDPDDIAILHLSTGSKINYEFAELLCKKVVMYHNITPPHFFKGYDNYIKEVNESGLNAVKYLADKVDYCIADSEYNKSNLIELGYKCDIDVMPILVPFEDYKAMPSQTIIDQYQDEYTNILFTGRIAPNKKQEDVIRAFYMYKKYFNPQARLFLVGAQGEKNIYYLKLLEYVKRLDLEDVFFMGHIPFEEVLAYYHLADVFLCQSEHEGFCVPLVEAMLFDIPIIAYSCTAIPYTLNQSGILIREKDPLFVAGMIDYLVRNHEVKQKIVDNQKERLQDFAFDKVQNQLAELIKKWEKAK